MNYRLRIFVAFPLAWILSGLLSCNESNNVNSNEQTASSESKVYQSEDLISVLPSPYYHQVDMGDKNGDSQISGMREYNAISCFTKQFDNGSTSILNREGNNIIGYSECAVLIEVKQFEGYNPYDIPFVIYGLGEIKSIKINGQDIGYDNSGNYLTRQSLSLNKGYNRVPIEIASNAGNVTTGFIEITVE